jgi:hypothetical protein
MVSKSKSAMMLALVLSGAGAPKAAERLLPQAAASSSFRLQNRRL